MLIFRFTCLKCISSFLSFIQPVAKIWNRCFTQRTCRSFLLLLMFLIGFRLSQFIWLICSNRLCQVATFIVQKVLLDDVGLEYMCTTAERFFALGRVLGNMVTSLAEGPSPRLLKHIIRCYLRLTDNPRCNNYPFFLIWKQILYNRAYTIQLLMTFRACDALGSCLPDLLRDATFSGCLYVSVISLDSIITNYYWYWYQIVIYQCIVILSQFFWYLGLHCF